MRVVLEEKLKSTDGSGHCDTEPARDPEAACDRLSGHVTSREQRP